MSSVLLVGKGPSAQTALESLAQRFDVVGVIRNVRQGRDGGDEVQRCARELGVRVLADTSLAGVARAVMRYRPDCTVISAYDRILSADILAHSRFVNVHYSLLPGYRGVGSVQWAIINGEPESGITVHAISSELDAGNILYQGRVAIGPDETAGAIYARLNAIQRRVLGETVERFLNGYTGEPQDESAASYVCSRVPADSEIDWSDSTDRIYAKIRAFHDGLSIPYPPAYTYLDSRRISITSAAPVVDPPGYVGRVPGRVVRRCRSTGCVDVLSGDGVLRIREVTTGESVAHPAAAVITSTRQTLGLAAAELLERIEALSRQLDEIRTRQEGRP